MEEITDLIPDAARGPWRRDSLTVHTADGGKLTLEGPVRTVAATLELVQAAPDLAVAAHAARAALLDVVSIPICGDAGRAALARLTAALMLAGVELEPAEIPGVPVGIIVGLRTDPDPEKQTANQTGSRRSSGTGRKPNAAICNRGAGRPEKST